MPSAEPGYPLLVGLASVWCWRRQTTWSNRTSRICSIRRWTSIWS